MNSDPIFRLALFLLLGIPAGCSGNVDNDTELLMLTVRVSVNDSLIEADNFSGTPSISSDGRYIAFSSIAPNLSPQEIFPEGIYQHVYVKDMETDTITMVTTNWLMSDESKGDSSNPKISKDGKFVCFESDADDLIENFTSPGPTGTTNIYFFSVEQPGTRILVSSDKDTVTAGGSNDSREPAISADGTLVAFSSSALNLVTFAFVFPTEKKIYVRRVIPISPTLLISQAGAEDADRDCTQPTLSFDGDKIAFATKATNLGPNLPSSAKVQIFLTNLLPPQVFEHATIEVPLGSGSGEGNGDSLNPVLSEDGNWLVFSSAASNISTQFDGDTRFDIYLRNLKTNFTTLISRNPGTNASASRDCLSPSISKNGNFIAFHTRAANLVEGDTNDINDIFVYNAQTSGMRRISVATYGKEGTSFTAGPEKGARFPSISSLGRFVAYQSTTENLVEDDGNGVMDAFVSGPLFGGK